MQSERIEFRPPKGVVPDDVSPGDTFDLVSTYRLKPEGDVCLIRIGDTEMPGYEEGEYEAKSKEHRKDYGDMMQSMHSAMSSGGDTDTGGGY